MSLSVQLQQMIYDRLRAHGGVDALVAGRIYDRVPETAEFPYVSFGPSDTIEDDSQCITGEIETLQIDCWSRHSGGFRDCKRLTGAVKGALHLYDGQLSEDALVALRVTNLRHFRDPDGQTSHGVVTVQAIMEEA